MSNFFGWNWKDWVSAGVSAGLIALFSYLAQITNLMEIDWKVALGVMLSAFSASMVKSLFTTNDGKFAGVIPVK